MTRPLGAATPSYYSARASFYLLTEELMSEHKSRNPFTRREALRKMGNGFGMMAFAGMLGDSVARAGGVVTPDGTVGVAKLDYPQRVKRVIFLFMNGGLSTLDAFDPKPMLDKYDGQPLPGGSISTERKT